MYTFNAFVEIPVLVDNAVDKIAKFGELSVKASTYSKDIRNFTNKAVHPDVQLTTFAILDESSSSVASSDVSEKVVNASLKVAAFLYTQYQNNAIPLPTSKPTLVNAINDEIEEVRQIYINSILESGIQGKRLIDNIRFDVQDGVKIYRCTLWFSDEAFRKQYPLYEVEVIPPLGDIDRLLQSAADVSDALSSIETDYVVNRIARATERHSSTTLYSHMVKWNDHEGKSRTKLETKWTVVIWGAAGNDLDVVKDAIRNYISIHSPNHDWAKTFPDLYSENEFLVIPMWDKLSTDTNGRDDGLYSSILERNDQDLTADRILPRTYTQVEEVKQKYLSMVGTTFRGINLLVVGNPNNVGGKVRINQMFPDYMAVTTDRPDFSRMTTKTQEWVLLLTEVLEIARNYTVDRSIPLKFLKTIKANREYIGFDYEGYTYYVLTRIGYHRDI